MVHKRVTMQDIADACGLSRNTVSKIFNDRGMVPDATKKLVLQKAQELGYYQVPDVETDTTPPRTKNIALLTSRMPKDYHFGILIIPVFAEQLSRNGYTLMIYEVSPDELRERRLPSHMLLSQTAGILGIELFDCGYIDMLCALNLPLLCVDAGMQSALLPMQCDYILMESISSVIALTSQVISAGARRIGFIGDPCHCRSFHERWHGFSLALEQAGIPLNRDFCILENDAEPYDDVDWVLAQIRRMPAVPEAFICATDFLAFRTMTALKRMGLAIPDDVMVTGFDDTPQAAVVEPALTTVQIPTTDFGRIAADILLERIEHPGRPFRSTYIRTNPVWRASTLR